MRMAAFSICAARDPAAAPVSLTQHPAPDPAAHYQRTFHADRVCFDARWPDLQARTTVWVSPEDDIEFRQVELRNLGERTLDIELISAFEVTLGRRARRRGAPGVHQPVRAGPLAGRRSRRWCSSASPAWPPTPWSTSTASPAMCSAPR
ncbi:hypothetical protein [Candidatus Skiveiella danica]|uniref:hypothetical protein n=1 Tax=Candidatus Skiveiella danica TaxID=3386177 RepID=UPI0039B82D2F